MNGRTISRLLWLGIFSLAFLPAVSWADPPACLDDTWIAPGQRTVTPAEVTGAPQQHLVLKNHHPSDSYWDTPNLSSGYLISGDKVDLVTTCDGYAYVRFHGPRRVSTGWVKAARIRIIGPSHSTLPPNAPALCEAAETTMNDGEPLASAHTTDLSNEVLGRVHLEMDGNSYTPQAAHILVDGRPLVAVVVDSGGTSHDSSVYVLSDDLRTLLSPSDRDDRDAENAGSDSWKFGTKEDVVIVDGQPMVLSWAAGEGKSEFYLSRIDRDGDIVPTCQGRRVALKHPTVKGNNVDQVCNAIIAGQPLPAPMHAPAAGESLVMTDVPPDYQERPASNVQGSLPGLSFRNNARASDASYTLYRTGMVDLDNSGTLRHVGLVSFDDGGSTAGDGSYHQEKVFPIYLSKTGVTDLSSAANQELADSLPTGMEDGRLVTLSGATYLELSPKDQGPPSEAWKIDSNGAQQICDFKINREVVQPLSP
ncbi:hypothetical protein [Oleiagrimonas soli]|uniref:Secreted protein n=1 Tax=Oleiagrimonas soli TaxID=1543381 RepID=A0A841KFR9_9GAMM|nr:hypothetical protein [Oleiagrimonas soli]MBB6182857.1 hypothetical protein [Oleiagrimonas soli]